MTARILVAYATRNGSTAEIAEAIGKEMEKTGVAVTVAEITTVRSLEGYTAVVIGGPLYMGRMDGQVIKFTKKFLLNLLDVPVAAFAVGIAPKDPKPEAIHMATEALNKAVEPLCPVSAVLFAGRLDPARIGFLMRKFMEMAKIPYGDFRDWDVIAAWARELPKKLHT